MSNRNQIEQQLITQRFVDLWVPSFPALPVKYENRAFTPIINQSWVAFSIRSGRVAEAAIGGIMPRGIGIVYLQIFLPDNSGTLLARQYVDAFADVFDNWHYVYAASPPYPRGDFWFKRVEVMPSAPRDGWHQWTASVEFKHDEQIVGPQNPVVTPPGGGVAVEIWVSGEIPSGLVNGVNQDYVTARPYVADTLAVFLNGIRQRRGDDYSETDERSFHFVNAPLFGDSISIDYSPSN